MKRRSGIAASLAATIAWLLVVGALVPAQERTAKVAAPDRDAKIDETKKAVSDPRGKAVAPVVGPRKAVEIRQPPPQPPPPTRARILQPNIEMLAGQAEAQNRPMLRAEYQFLVTVCEPSKPQRKSIARAAEVASGTAARRVAEWLMGLAPDGLIGPPLRPDSRKIVRDALAAAVKDNLSPGQAALYRDELARRVEFQERCAVENLVVRLDRGMRLGPDQREAIRASLVAHWNDPQAAHLHTLANVYEDHYFPLIPDSWLTPLLTPAQRKAWAVAFKIHADNFAEGLSKGPMENTPLADAELAEPAKPGPRP